MNPNTEPRSSHSEIRTGTTLRSVRSLRPNKRMQLPSALERDSRRRHPRWRAAERRIVQGDGSFAADAQVVRRRGREFSFWLAARQRRTYQSRLRGNHGAGAWRAPVPSLARHFLAAFSMPRSYSRSLLARFPSRVDSMNETAHTFLRSLRGRPLARHPPRSEPPYGRPQLRPDSENHAAGGCARLAR